MRARFNEEIGQAELEACLKELAELGVDERDVMVATVPGALELGVALSHMAETFEFDALIALGAVIRGETYHFEVVSNEMATAITRISLETGIPIANGVLTVDTDEQAQARAAGRAATAPRWPSKWPTWSRRWNPRKKTKTTRTKILTTKKTTTSADSAAQARANARSARRRAREFALQGVYAWLLRGGEGTQDAGEIDAHLRDTEDFSEADAQWFKTLLHGVLREAPTLRERFTPYVDRPLAELSPVEHGILLIGSFELIHHVEVPYKVAINEAVELAKSFGGTDGFKFVNGVLDKLAADVRAHEVQAAAQRSGAERALPAAPRVSLQGGAPAHRQGRTARWRQH